jgi:hypothetical protein
MRRHIDWLCAFGWLVVSGAVVLFWSWLAGVIWGGFF